MASRKVGVTRRDYSSDLPKIPFASALWKPIRNPACLPDIGARPLALFRRIQVRPLKYINAGPLRFLSR